MRVLISKAEIEQLQACMAAQKPLTPVSGEWSPSSSLVGAAVLFHQLLYHVLSAGERFHPDRFPREHNEGVSETATRELLGAIFYVSSMVGGVMLGTFDATFEGAVAFDVTVDGDKHVVIEHVAGFKGEPGRYQYDL